MWKLEKWWIWGPKIRPTKWECQWNLKGKCFNMCIRKGLFQNLLISATCVLASVLANVLSEWGSTFQIIPKKYQRELWQNVVIRMIKNDKISPNVIYWPSTKPSIKRCTCVNKQRNSGSRWASDNYITRCHRRLGSVPVAVEVGVGVSWGTRCQRENQLADWGLVALRDPWLSNPSQDEEEVLLWSEELWVYM